MLAQSFRFAVDIVALVDATVLELLEAFTILKIAFPFSFVDAVVRVHHHAQTVPFSIDNFPIECRVFVLLQLEIGRLVQLLEVDDVGLWLVGLEFADNCFETFA